MRTTTLQLEQSEQQKLVDTMEPTLHVPSVSIESDPILQNSLQGVKRFIASDPLLGSSASGKVVELNDIRPTREGSIPQWQMSDSSDDDLGIEAEVVIPMYLYKQCTMCLSSSNTSEGHDFICTLYIVYQFIRMHTHTLHKLSMCDLLITCTYTCNIASTYMYTCRCTQVVHKPQAKL